MALQDEINGLRRLMESINKLAASNSQSVGKMTNDVTALKQELQMTRHIADRALQLCNDLIPRIAALENVARADHS